jgi:2-polyprenyl-3-methyl-5-hydroxy-6-metoxy-1,4-benzoquinol methylase
MTFSQPDEPAAVFPETADIETSSDAYARRFAGPVGQWMLSVQERITLEFLKDAPGTPVLDIGGGHGQLAVPLCRAGWEVTVLGSSPSCRQRVADIVAAGQCTFQVGNVVDLPFPDRSFDTVICFRLLTHCSRWPELIREMCRVASRAVVADYPTSQGLNKIAPVLFKAKQKIEGDTRTWALFRHARISGVFAECGFDVHGRRGQFFLPMVVHRALKCRGLSVAMEGMCKALGLTRLWGSPVIIEARRRRE